MVSILQAALKRTPMSFIARLCPRTRFRGSVTGQPPQPLPLDEL